MKRLPVSRKIWVMLGAVVLIAAASSTAFAKLDPGPVSDSTSPVSPGRAVEFSGAVEVMAIDGWTISGQTVKVTPQTRLKDAIDIGYRVKVQARVQADGSLVALRIQLENSGRGRGNENENHNGNINSNENDNENENHNGNVNSNENDNENENHNGNVNTNHNDDDDHGGNSHHNGDDQHEGHENGDD